MLARAAVVAALLGACGGDPPGPDAPPAQPPETTLTEGPAEITRAVRATFVFTASVAGAAFECSLDGAPFAACSAPHAVDVVEGEHTFAARARAGGAADASPATHAWRVDLTAPRTTILTGPDSQMAMSEAVFTFAASEDASFTCSVDGATPALCESGVRFSELGLGGHTFAVRAVDLAVNEEPASQTWAWTVTAITPNTVITKQPESPFRDPAVIFEFSSSVEGARFECKLNDEDPEACTSPKEYDLEEGTWTFEVVAIDPGGRRDPSPARHVWVSLFPFW